jgi:GT2 family glycosyltransferase
MPNNKDILISIVIVNYKVPDCLIEALQSLRLAEYYGRSEVIIVDNASGDNSREIVTARFQEVQWIQLKTNIGFGKACNIGAEAACGQYLLLLNPDTVVSSNTLVNAVEFMEAHPKAGLMGPKILNPDGTLQLSCRRSIPTPSVAFYYFTGLSHAFPKSKRFGRYHLTYMDEDEMAQVDVLSGSFMFMRRDIFDIIGGFDKRFFMYGEDIDLCYRVRQTGYEVWYYPTIKIVHQKGKSSSKRLIRSRIYFYEAMIIFSRKYRNIQDTYFPWWLMWAGIVFQAALSIGIILARSTAAVLFDLAVINGSLWAGLSFLPPLLDELPLYETEPLWWIIGAQALISCAFILMFAYNGVYSARQYSVRNIFLSGVLTSALVISGVHFLTGYSVMGFVAAAALAVILTSVWREALMGAVKGIKRLLFAPEKALIVGHGPAVAEYIRNIEGQSRRIIGPKIVGVIRLGQPGGAEQIEGYPVLGGITGLKEALEREKIDALLIAAAQPWYTDIINILAEYRNKGINIRWEAME